MDIWTSIFLPRVAISSQCGAGTPRGMLKKSIEPRPASRSEAGVARVLYGHIETPEGSEGLPPFHLGGPTAQA